MRPTTDSELKLTSELLEVYSKAALTNAQSLLSEATLLYNNHHYARAYFLAVASIEETGKSVLAHQSRGRNLKDSSVSSKLKSQFASHSEKIYAAFHPWIKNLCETIDNSEFESEVTSLIGTIISLINGREPSMYTDIHENQLMVLNPESIVKSDIANNCICLSTVTISHATSHITSLPKFTSQKQDEFFTMKKSLFSNMVNTADFWWYYISRMESGDKLIENAATEYNKNFFSKHVKFRSDME